MQLDELHPTITKKEEKYSFKILNCEHITYAVNTLKFEYLPLGKPTAAKG